MKALTRTFQVSYSSNSSKTGALDLEMEVWTKLGSSKIFNFVDYGCHAQLVCDCEIMPRIVRLACGNYMRHSLYRTTNPWIFAHDGCVWIQLFPWYIIIVQRCYDVHTIPQSIPGGMRRTLHGGMRPGIFLIETRIYIWLLDVNLNLQITDGLGVWSRLSNHALP